MTDHPHPLAGAVKPALTIAADAAGRNATRSATMHLWVQDQYDKDLASWRARAASHLTKCNLQPNPSTTPTNGA